MKKILISIGKALFYFLVYFAVQFAFILGYVIILILTGKISILSGDVEKVQQQMTDLVTGKVVPITVITNTLTIIAFLLITLIRKHKLKEAFYLNRIPAGSVFLIMLLGVIMNLTLSYGMDFLSKISPAVEKTINEYNEYASFMNEASLLPLVILTVISAPLTEEILLRCFIFTRLRYGIPQALSVIITSVAFGLLHGQIFWAIYAAIIGILLNVLFIKYNSLYASLLMHFAFNTVSFIIIPALFNVPIIAEGIILGACLVVSALLVYVILKKKMIPKTL